MDKPIRIVRATSLDGRCNVRLCEGSNVRKIEIYAGSLILTYRLCLRHLVMLRDEVDAAILKGRDQDHV